MHLPRTDFHLRIRDGLRVLACTVALAFAMPAFADDYTEVNQLIRANKPAEAIAKADQYIAAKPRDPQMRFLKGLAEGLAGNRAAAIATFTRITEEYPELSEPYNNLAVLYAAEGQFDKARIALEAAVRANPTYSTAHENIGDVYAKMAQQAYAKAQQLDATNNTAQPKLAVIRQLFPGTKAP